MTIRTTREILAGSKKVILIEKFDEHNNLVESESREQVEVLRKVNRYNERNLLIESIEYQDGEQSSLTTFEYTEDGEVAREELFVAGELFELETRTVEGDKTTYLTIHGSEETSRIEEIKQDNQKTIQFFEYGEFVEQQVFKTIGTTEAIEYFVPEKYVGKTEKIHNSEGLILEEKSFDDKNNLQWHSEFKYDGNLLLSIRCVDYTGNDYDEVVYSYTYDERKNLIHEEAKTSTGKILHFYTAKYDEENRAIMESGFTMTGFNAGYGQVFQGDHFHREHSYETV